MSLKSNLPFDLVIILKNQERRIIGIIKNYNIVSFSTSTHDIMQTEDTEMGSSLLIQNKITPVRCTRSALESTSLFLPHKAQDCSHTAGFW